VILRCAAVVRRCVARVRKVRVALLAPVAAVQAARVGLVVRAAVPATVEARPRRGAALAVAPATTVHCRA